MTKMKIKELAHQLQILCHEGYSHNEIYFQHDESVFDITNVYNTEGNTVLAGVLEGGQNGIKTSL